MTNKRNVENKLDRGEVIRVTLWIMTNVEKVSTCTNWAEVGRLITTNVPEVNGKEVSGTSAKQFCDELGIKIKEKEETIIEMILKHIDVLEKRIELLESR